MRSVQVGGEPGGGPLGSSYEKLYADVMTTRKGWTCCGLRDVEGAGEVEDTCSTLTRRWG
jgi:hypothetical protein